MVQTRRQAALARANATSGTARRARTRRVVNGPVRRSARLNPPPAPPTTRRGGGRRRAAARNRQRAPPSPPRIISRRRRALSSSSSSVVAATTTSSSSSSNNRRRRGRRQPRRTTNSNNIGTFGPNGVYTFGRNEDRHALERGFDIAPLAPVIRDEEQVRIYINNHNDRMRDVRPRRSDIVNFFRSMRFNSTIHSGAPLHLGGLTLRELCEIIDDAGVDRRSLYISGTCVDYEATRRGSGMPIGGVGAAGNQARVAYQLKRIIGVPMSEISWDPSVANMVSDRLPLTDVLGAFVQRIFQSEQTGSSDIPQSMMVVNDDIRITRRRYFPYQYHGLYQFRTGGFDRLVLYDSVHSIPGQFDGRLYIPGSADRYTAKLPNCVLQCLAWGLAQIALDDAMRVVANGRITDTERKNIEITAAFEAKSIYHQFFNEWFTDKVSEYWANHAANTSRGHLNGGGGGGGTTSPTRYTDYNRHVSRLKSHWNRLIIHGFSNVLLRRLVRFLCRYDILLDILLYDRTTQKYVRAGEASVRSTDLRRSIDYPFRNEHPIRTIVCLQVNLDGAVQTTDILEAPPEGIPMIWDSEHESGFHSVYGKDVFPGLLHCIALYPPSLSPILRRTETEALSSNDSSFSMSHLLEATLEDARFHALKSALDTTISTQLRKTFALSNVLNLGIGENDMYLRRIVETQRKRMEECSTFVPRGYSTAASTSYSSERAQDVERETNSLLEIEQDGGGGAILITPYGESSSSSSSSNFSPTIGVIVYDCETVENLRGCQDRVGPAFRKECPINSSSIDDDDLSAIYTVPESHIPYTVQWGLVDMHSDLHLDSENGSVRDILYDRVVHICYGGENRLLGDCVEEFLLQVHSEAISRGLKKVFCYAHNGCGFDTYMILHYTHSDSIFKFRDILVTSRGILSVELEAVVNRHKVVFVFRDTKLFFNASLSDLCKIFKVPSEFCKTDFPITRVHARNYFYPEFTGAVREYMENDVWSLAYITRGINDIIRRHILNGTQQHHQQSLPITQNITLMSLVTYLQRKEFCRHNMPCPFAVDIPSLRNFVSYANMGGRVLPFWRSYRSAFCSDVLRSLIVDYRSGMLDHHKAERAEIYRQCVLNKAYGEVLDVTSLYPYAMSHYPMPTGLIRHFPEASSLFYSNIVPTLDCERCHFEKRLCVRHLPSGEENLAKKLALGHFVFFVIRNVVPPKNILEEEGQSFYNICPRKSVYRAEKGRGTSSSKASTSLLYSFETEDEAYERHNQKLDLPRGVQCYTMFDLYWMFKTGWTFHVQSAFGFESTYIYRESLLGMFEQRKIAKRREQDEGLPKSLSTMWKNLYNGGYGINARQDITKQHIICGATETEESLRAKGKLNPDEIVVRDCSSFQLENKQWILKVRKHPDSAEYFAKQSPNQIGAAVTSAARHHMNLLMYSLKNDEYGYTDTDSLFTTGAVVQRIQEEAPWLLDESPEAEMGTYKNDHEGPGHQIVIGSFLLAKKVKLHVTLNAFGDVFFHETFKGFNPSKIDPDNGKLHTPEYLLFQKVCAIVQIHFFGQLQDTFHQTEWRRNISSGITIHANKPFDIDPDVYGNDNGSFIISKQKEGVHALDIWTPHGSYLAPISLEEKYSIDEIREQERQNNDSDHWFQLWTTILTVWGERITKYITTENQENDDRLFTESLPSLSPQDYQWNPIITNQ